MKLRDGVIAQQNHVITLGRLKHQPEKTVDGTYHSLGVLHHFLQKGNQLVGRFLPVAELPLLFQAHLSKSTGTSFGNKNRIITKAF